MKPIHFENNKNWLWITVLVLSLIFILVGTFELIKFENPKTNNTINLVGYSLQILFYSNHFWRKNYVQWNKVNMMIRINSWTGNNIRFNTIETPQLIDKKLIITKANGDKVTFDMTKIQEADTQKLLDIILKNTSIKTVKK
ncbi:hypothetical protein [Olleya namhaensis]|uniref:hypothetical protein n=1 Tax=Olleya namhaensis TaxID=1144750 RepID=UPI002490BB3C|nr:hypothetical protein [Olleya namhaensis]